MREVTTIIRKPTIVAYVTLYELFSYDLTKTPVRRFVAYVIIAGNTGDELAVLLDYAAALLIDLICSGCDPSQVIDTIVQ